MPQASVQQPFIWTMFRRDLCGWECADQNWPRLFTLITGKWKLLPLASIRRAELNGKNDDWSTAIFVRRNTHSAVWVCVCICVRCLCRSKSNVRLSRKQSHKKQSLTSSGKSNKYITLKSNNKKPINCTDYCNWNPASTASGPIQVSSPTAPQNNLKCTRRTAGCSFVLFVAISRWLCALGELRPCSIQI